jgi:hypothetical protein
METEEDIFVGCDLDEIFALVFDQEGADGLRVLLARAALDRESLTTAGDRLEAAGLLEAAGIVRESAARAADRRAVEIAAILQDPIPGNRRALLASMYRRSVVSMADLIPQGLDSDALAYVAKTRRCRDVPESNEFGTTRE